jgi:hypothetical protein
LGSDDREGGEGDTVELIEATPHTSGAKSLEDLAHTLVVVLGGAVEHNDPNSERATKILGGLSLASSGGSSGSTTIAHTESLRQGDVAAISKRRNGETLSHTKELIRVGEVDVANRNDGVLILGLVVHTSVLHPVDIVDGLGRLGLVSVADFKSQITLMYLNGNESLDLGTNKLAREVLKTHS